MADWPIKTNNFGRVVVDGSKLQTVTLVATFEGGARMAYAMSPDDMDGMSGDLADDDLDQLARGWLSEMIVSATIEFTT